MTGALAKIVVWFILGAVTLVVPRDKYQRRLDALPAMAHKADGHGLRGWTYTHVVSPVSHATHYFYSYPCPDSALPVLLMLHGFNTDGRTFSRLTDLAAHYRLLAYNFPEESEFYKGKFTDFTELLDDFCSVLGIDTLCVAGNSIGGAIAQCFTATSSKVHVKRLLLISTEIFGATPRDRARNEAMAGKLLKLPDYKLYFLLDRTRALLQGLERAGYGEDAPLEILVIKRIAWYRQILRSLEGYDGSVLIGRVTCPVIALHGTADRVIPLKLARSIQTFIPSAHFELVQGGGHAMAFVDGPAIAKRLRELCGHVNSAPEK